MVAIGAKDPANPTAAEMTAASAWAEKHHVAEHPIRVNINNQPPPALTPAQSDALQNPPAQGQNEAFLKSLDPRMAVDVKAIANGVKKLPGGTAAKDPYWKAVGQNVLMYDPQWSEQRAQLRHAFASGKDGTNIGNLNTAAVHLDQLGDAAKALGNGTFTPANHAFQYLKQAFGNAAPTNFEGMRAVVSGELANALKGQATDPEIANIKSTVERSASPQALSGVIDTYLPAVASKLETYHQRWQQQMPNDSWSPVLPAARAVFARHGIGGGSSTGGMVNMRSPDGQTKAVPADQVEHYKSKGAVVVQ